MEKACLEYATTYSSTLTTLSARHTTHTIKSSVEVMGTTSH
jgi:hypothetical protein